MCDSGIRRQIIFDNPTITIFYPVRFLIHLAMSVSFLRKKGRKRRERVALPFCSLYIPSFYLFHLSFSLFATRGAAAPTNRRINFLSPSSDERTGSLTLCIPLAFSSSSSSSSSSALASAGSFSNALNAPVGQFVLHSTHRDSSIRLLVVAFRRVTGIYIAASIARDNYFSFSFLRRE